jgi:predicted membrane protein
VSDPPEGWHEDARVTATRLVCQLLVTLSVLGFSVFLVLTHPEYNAGVALVCGVVLGTWFAVPHELHLGRRRRHKDAEDD